MSDDNDTLVFVSSLLDAKTTEKEWFRSSGVSHKVFASDAKYVKWIIEHEKDTGQYPTKREFEKRFELKLPKPEPNARAALNPILDNHMFRSMATVIERCQDVLQSGKGIRKAVLEFKKLTSEIETFDPASLNAVDVFNSAFAHMVYKDKVEMSTLIEEGKLTMPMYPWDTMNEILDYSEFGEFVVIAARTSIGKTWLALYIALFMAELGFDVVFYSLENPKRKIIPRIACMRYKLSYKRFRRGDLTPREMALFNKGRQRDRGKFKLRVVDMPDLGTLQTEKLKEDVMAKKPQIIFVDGAYLLKTGDASKINNMSDRGGSISKELVSIGKLEDILVIGTVQLGRDGEEDDANHKQLRKQSRLKKVFGSDQWAQDADTLITISGMRNANTREIHIDKGRETETASFTVNFLCNPPDFSEVKTVSTAVKQTVARKDDVEFKGF